jgi:hypothetical protein
MPCPYRREFLMVSCDGWPVKKPVRSDQLVPAGPCATGDFEHCPVFKDSLARLKNAAEGVPSPAANHDS